MSMFGGIEEPWRRAPQRSGRAVAGHQEPRRPARTERLCTGTLACARCDAPVAVGPGPLAVTDQLTCPFCDNRGPVREFLSLAAPTRPARVVVRLQLPGTWAHL